MFKSMFYSRFSILVFAAFILLPSIAFAQKANPVSSTAKSPSYVENVPSCEVLIPNIKKKMQARADQKCETQRTCVKCKIGNSNDIVYASLFVQPESKKCKSGVKVIHDSAVSDGKNHTLTAADNNPDISTDDGVLYSGYEIVQTHCLNKGVTLEVYIPGSDLAKPSKKRPTHSYLWTIDGKKAGHEKQLECVCGDMATVTVTHLKSGRKIKKSVVLRKCDDR